MEVNLKIKDGELVEVLNVLLSEHKEMKEYFKENVSEESRIGMTSPEEIKEIYNNILYQAKEQGVLNGLNVLNVLK